MEFTKEMERAINVMQRDVKSLRQENQELKSELSITKDNCERALEQCKVNYDAYSIVSELQNKSLEKIDVLQNTVDALKEEMGKMRLEMANELSKYQDMYKEYNEFTKPNEIRFSNEIENNKVSIENNAKAIKQLSNITVLTAEATIGHTQVLANLYDSQSKDSEVKNTAYEVGKGYNNDLSKALEKYRLEHPEYEDEKKKNNIEKGY